MMRRRRLESGNAVVEMTLIGIPIIFVLISIFEISRGMWMYTTLAYAAREGTRYMVVHGQNCRTAPNNCGITVQNVAERIRDAGVGLVHAETQVTLNAGGTPTSPSQTLTCMLSACLTNAAVWPPIGYNSRETTVAVTIVSPFRSALAMFWPGAGKTNFAPSFPLPATSIDYVQF